jgi:hypothetical protein
MDGTPECLVCGLYDEALLEAVLVVFDLDAGDAIQVVSYLHDDWHVMGQLYVVG